MEGNISLHQQEVDRYPVKDYFSIDGRSPEYDEDCDFIIGWAETKGIKKKEDLALELKKMEYRLGSPPLGESRIKRMVNYLRADAKLTDALKEVASKEQGWGGMI